MRHILIHYNEIALKGNNRPFFEQKLASNIKLVLPSAKINRLQGRILAEVPDGDSADVLKNVFGISSYSPAVFVKTDFEEIKKRAAEIIKNQPGKTFKVETRRPWKQFSRDSMEISREVGAHILKNSKLKVDVKNPDISVRIEVMKGKSFIYCEKIKGPGGLPVGVSGRVLCLISGGIDSPVAAYLMMKRGCPVDFIHFHSYPQTDRASIEKAEELVKIINKFQPAARPKLHLVPILDFQKEVLKTSDPALRVIFYRRMMYRIAEAVAEETGAKALVSGDNLGQVASQTVENMAVIGEGIELPIFRPLLCFDKEEIIGIAKKIGTYEVSIEPHGDCCSVFLPPNPATKARLKDVLKEEKKLKIRKHTKKIIENFICQKSA